jgi:hypothetical protein
MPTCEQCLSGLAATRGCWRMRGCGFRTTGVLGGGGRAGQNDSRRCAAIRSPSLSGSSPGALSGAACWLAGHRMTSNFLFFYSKIGKFRGSSDRTNVELFYLLFNTIQKQCLARLAVRYVADVQVGMFTTIYGPCIALATSCNYLGMCSQLQIYFPHLYKIPQ